MNIENEYDIIVTGGGPGGSGSAFSAAKKGMRVLVLEKRQEIGAPKRCAEGLSVSALKRMGIRKHDSWIRREMKGATVYAPNGKFIRADFSHYFPGEKDVTGPENGPEGYVVERKLFDKHLAEKAIEAGTRILARAEVLRLLKENGKICGVEFEFEGERKKVKSKIVIAADGVESKLAREAGIDTTLRLVDIASCAQFEMSGVDIDPDRIEMYFGNDIAPGGYVWIFPKGDKIANVGIGVRKPFAKERAIDYLNRFVESRPGLRKGSIIEVNSGGVPVGGFMENMVTDNFIIAGDAAHQANPVHGGGIAEAWVGGRLAGEVASQAIKANDTSKEFLGKYNKLWWKERGNKLKKLLAIREIMESMSDDDMNWLSDYVKGEDLIEISRSSGFSRFAKLLMKRPRLIKFARKLL